MLTELDILFDITDKLEHLGIKYMLTGSLAMNYYSLPRMTRDIDVVIELKEADLGKIITMFKRDYYLSPKSMQEAVENSSMFNIIHDEAVIKVDFIIRKESEYRKVEFSRRKKVKILDHNIWIVTKEDLVISKLLWAQDSLSQIQKMDIENLLKSGYDKAYLSRWLKTLFIYDFSRDFLNGRYFN